MPRARLRNKAFSYHTRRVLYMGEQRPSGGDGTKANFDGCDTTDQGPRTSRQTLQTMAVVQVEVRIQKCTGTFWHSRWSTTAAFDRGVSWCGQKPTKMRWLLHIWHCFPNSSAASFLITDCVPRSMLLQDGLALERQSARSFNACRRPVIGTDPGHPKM